MKFLAIYTNFLSKALVFSCVFWSSLSAGDRHFVVSQKSMSSFLGPDEGLFGINRKKSLSPVIINSRDGWYMLDDAQLFPEGFQQDWEDDDLTVNVAEVLSANESDLVLMPQDQSSIISLLNHLYDNQRIADLLVVLHSGPPSTEKNRWIVEHYSDMHPVAQFERAVLPAHRECSENQVFSILIYYCFALRLLSHSVAAVLSKENPHVLHQIRALFIKRYGNILSKHDISREKRKKAWRQSEDLLRKEGICLTDRIWPKALPDPRWVIGFWEKTCARLNRIFCEQGKQMWRSDEIVELGSDPIWYQKNLKSFWEKAEASKLFGSRSSDT